MTNLFEVNLINIVPHNLVDASTKAFCHSVDLQIQKRIKPAIDLLNIWANIENADSSLLDYMAVEFRTQYYDSSLPVEIKKNLIINTLIWYMTAGTDKAVEELACTVFGSGKIIDWYSYDGEPYHFKIQTENHNISEDALRIFSNTIKNVKRTTAILDAVEIVLSAYMNTYYGAILHTGDYITLRQEGI